jgi:FdhD protein
MGRDKALLEVDGQPMVQRALGVLRALLPEVVLVAPPRQGYSHWGAELVPDLRPGLGPLAGLHAALKRAAGRPVFLLACDLPFVSEDLVDHLLTATYLRDTEAWARIPIHLDRAQPLCGLYGAGCLPLVERELDRGQLSVFGLLDCLEIDPVEIDTSLSWYRSYLFENINALQDLARVESNSDMPREERPQPDLATRRSVVSMPVVRHAGSTVKHETDQVTVEEPLEMRVVVEEGGKRVRHSLAITMRTPGKDRELAAGFLVSEGVVRRRQDILSVEHCRSTSPNAGDNVVDVQLAPSTRFDFESLARHVITTSACGICGRASIDSVQKICSRRPQGAFTVQQGVLLRLIEVLEGSQPVFSRTGGLHAAALFDFRGRLAALREDVGRHNAMDKLVGSLLFDAALPANDHLVLVSGRASFELVQKALLAGIPILAAVGAPTSLAVELAAEYGMTLVGFLRDERFNVYSGSERIDSS